MDTISNGIPETHLHVDEFAESLGTIKQELVNNARMKAKAMRLEREAKDLRDQYKAKEAEIWDNLFDAGLTSLKVDGDQYTLQEQVYGMVRSLNEFRDWCEQPTRTWIEVDIDGVTTKYEYTDDDSLGTVIWALLAPSPGATAADIAVPNITRIEVCHENRLDEFFELKPRAKVINEFVREIKDSGGDFPPGLTERLNHYISSPRKQTEEF